MKILDIIKTPNSNLWRNKLRTVLNILAIFVAALTLTLTVGIGAGLKNYLNTLFKTVEAPAILVATKKDPSSSGSGIKIGGAGIQEYTEGTDIKDGLNRIQVSYDQFKSDIKDIKNIDTVSKVFSGPFGLSGINAKYIENDQGAKHVMSIEVLVKGFEVKILDGGQKINSKNEVIIPYKLLTIYGWSESEAIGKVLKIVYTNQAQKIEVVEVKIVGVATSTLFTSDLYISYELAEEMFKYSLSGTVIPAEELIVKAKYSSFMITANSTDATIIDTLITDFDKVGYKLVRFSDSISDLNKILDGIQYALLAFSTISLIAASFGIVNTMIISVLERTKEIGLSKALGMSSMVVFVTFLLEAILLGFWGAISGIIVATIIGRFINVWASGDFLKDFPGFDLFLFDPLQILGIIGLICAVCLIAGSLPSLRASKLNPIEALKYE